MHLSDIIRNYESFQGVLLYIMNEIISTATIPDSMKQARVVPLFKGGKNTDVSNYRPISVLQCLAQILEKHVYNTMYSFLVKHELFSHFQHGFIRGKGTHSVLEELSDYLHLFFDQNMVTCVLFLDVSKAFDSVNHELLLEKLLCYGFRGHFHALLKSYLTNRSQSVHTGSSLSYVASLRTGVPQGSILSPLYSIYT